MDKIEFDLRVRNEAEARVVYTLGVAKEVCQSAVFDQIWEMRGHLYTYFRTSRSIQDVVNLAWAVTRNPTSLAQSIVAVQLNSRHLDGPIRWEVLVLPQPCDRLVPHEIARKAIAQSFMPNSLMLSYTARPFGPKAVAGMHAILTGPGSQARRKADRELAEMVESLPSHAPF